MPSNPARRRRGDGALAGIVRRTASASARPPRAVIALWFLLVIGCFVAGGIAGFVILFGLSMDYIVMVAVFAVFAALRLLDMKQLGFGLAAAVLLDATLVRGVALPAAVALLGDRGWRVRRRTAGRPQWDHGRPAVAVGSSHGS